MKVPVIFDLDGTLIDSAPDLHAAANRVMADIGAAPFDLAQVTSFIGNGVPVLVARMIATRGLAAERQDDLTARFLAQYAADPATLTRPYRHVEKTLRDLAGAGHPLGICTNKPEAPARRILGLLGLAGHFGAVVGGDSVASRKPDAAPLHQTMRLLDAQTCVFVGDSEVDAETAQNAGVPFLLFTQGYRKSPVDAMPHRVAFDDFAALAGIVAALP